MRVSAGAADGGRGQEEGREMSESITERLRFMSEDLVSIVDLIDTQFDRELRAKQDEGDVLTERFFSPRREQA